MSTLTLRTVSAGDQHAQGAIKVNSAPYRTKNPTPKSGVLELTISSIVVTYGTGGSGSPAGVLDVRPPQFNEACDTPIKDNVTLTGTTQTITFSGDDGKYYFAVNDGVPGPSVRQHQDGSWSLMQVGFDLNDGVNDSATVVVNYSLAWTDLTASLLTTP